jgi:predicted dienelactone hydrolase
VLLSAGIAVAMLSLANGGAGSPRAHASTGTSSATSAGSSAAGSGSVGTRPTPMRNLSVTTTQIPLVDTSRPLVSDGQVLAPERSLPTTVYRPVASGRFPLVVFVHGYDVGPSTYQRFCTEVASAGYVVAAPSFPLEDPSRGYPLDRSDLPNEATDVSFVISSLLHASVGAKIDPSEIAVAGHSDGADVALMVGYQDGLSDPRVDAVIADAPDPMSGAAASSTRPLLLVQGNADSVVPYSSSQAVFGQVQAPRYYVTLLGADHLAPIEGGTPWTPVLDDAAIDFLDATVAGRGPGVQALPGQLSSSSLEQLQAAG